MTTELFVQILFGLIFLFVVVPIAFTFVGSLAISAAKQGLLVEWALIATLLCVLCIIAFSALWPTVNTILCKTLQICY